MDRKDTRQTRIIRNARKCLGLSQLDVATEAEVNLRQYQRYEYGERSFSDVKITFGLKICCILHIDPYDIVFGESDEREYWMSLAVIRDEPENAPKA